VGVSEISVAELARARQLVDIASVQNRFNVAERTADLVLRMCEEQTIGFLPWAPESAWAADRRRSAHSPTRDESLPLGHI
jgi:pyridoxine 4-dehydrogenase